MVSVNPGPFATAVHNIGASTRVTVNLSGGWPFTRIVIFAPTTKGPSILAFTMTSPGHWAGFVHAAHTSSALAEEWDEPPNGPFASPMLQFRLVQYPPQPPLIGIHTHAVVVHDPVVGLGA